MAAATQPNPTTQYIPIEVDPSVCLPSNNCGLRLRAWHNAHER